MSTRVLRTRSQSGIRQARKSTFTETTESSDEKPSGPSRRKRRSPSDNKSTTSTTTMTTSNQASQQQSQPRIKLKQVVLKKPKYLSKANSQLEGHYEPARVKSKQEYLERLEVCASLITPTLRMVSPKFQEQIEQLRKFEMFKSFEMDLGSLNLLRSEVYEMDEDDKKLMMIMEMDNGKEQDELMYKHYGLKSKPGKEEYNDLFAKREDAIEEFYLNG